jgi:hypothetical protein
MQSSLIDLYSVYGGSFNDRTSTCNDHAAFSSGCGPYLVRMIHGKKARPIQKDGTLQRFLLGGLGPAPTVGQPWGDPPLKPAWFASESARACCPMYLPRRGPVCSVVADSRAR